LETGSYFLETTAEATAMMKKSRKNLAAASCVILSTAIGTQVAQAQERLVTVAATEADEADGLKKFNVYLTGYTFWDNTPPGSAEIARPVLRNKAGGTGTWQSPITIAVGHRIENGRQTLDFPAGTRFYLPRLQKYAIVEDVCGDGATPQNGPCHSGYKGHPWLDIWIGGKAMSAAEADECARRITAVQPIILEPPSNLPVQKGEIASNGCKVYS
jgi:hypothetical protein